MKWKIEIFSIGQVRQVLGITLTILCSNVRLYHKSHHDSANDERQSNADNYLKDASWVQSLIGRAAEAVVNIQNATQSDKGANSMEINLENGRPDGDSQDDIKWMETVIMAANIEVLIVLIDRSLIVCYSSFM